MKRYFQCAESLKMTEPRKPDEFIPVSQVLNSKPQLGPIPGEQVIPWISIIVVTYVVCQEFLKLNSTVTWLVCCWGMATWWGLTGNASWKFLSKFQSVPRWTRGHLNHVSLLERQNTAVAERQTQRLRQSNQAKNSKAKRGLG